MKARYIGVFHLSLPVSLAALSIPLLAKPVLAFAVVTVAVLSLHAAIAVLLTCNIGL